MSADITPIPRIGADAPDFTAITTHGEITFSSLLIGTLVRR